MRDIEPLICFASNLMKIFLRDTYDQYFQIEVPGKKVSVPWTSIVVNRTISTVHHVDTKDVTDGYSFLTFGGSWKEGGNLLLLDLGLELPTRPGDIVLFQSGRLLHAVSPCIGDRHSIIFNVHDTVIH